jgi:cellulose biosynthesis protein BcsQ
MKQLAFNIQKGGVGKTTLSGNIAWLLSQNQKVAIIDCNPLTPEYFSVDGISIFNNELQKLNHNFRRKVRFNKIACNLVNRSFRRHADFIAALRRLDYDLFLSRYTLHCEGLPAEISVVCLLYSFSRTYSPECTDNELASTHSSFP